MRIAFFRADRFSSLLVFMAICDASNAISINESRSCKDSRLWTFALRGVSALHRLLPSIGCAAFPVTELLSRSVAQPMRCLQGELRHQHSTGNSMYSVRFVSLRRSVPFVVIHRKQFHSLSTTAAARNRRSSVSPCWTA